MTALRQRMQEELRLRNSPASLLFHQLILNSIMLIRRLTRRYATTDVTSLAAPVCPQPALEPMAQPLSYCIHSSNFSLISHLVPTPNTLPPLSHISASSIELSIPIQKPR